MTVDAHRDVLEAEALHQRRRAARDLHALDAAPHAAARFVERLAVLGRDGASQVGDAGCAGGAGGVEPGWPTVAVGPAGLAGPVGADPGWDQ